MTANFRLCFISWLGFLFFCTVTLGQAETMAGSTSSSSYSGTGFASILSPGNVEYVSLNLSPSSVKQLRNDWDKKFSSPSHAIHSHDSHKNPEEALLMIDEAFCFITQFLPPALVSKLHQFAFDPQAPCALVIRGLGLFKEQEVPPTPVLQSIFATTRQARCPMAETMLLGLSRLCGTPHGPPLPRHAPLVRDLCPTTSATSQAGEFLPMHRDYPQQVSPNGWEPELLLLSCVRPGNPSSSAAATVITDSHVLYQHLSVSDRYLLQSYKIQTQTRNADGTWVNLGQSFYAVQGCRKDGSFDAQTSCLTLYNLNGLRHTCDEALGDTQLEQRILAAYERLCQTAEALGERVWLAPGDVLILNNARCVHGRTAYQPRLDGTDRWLIKTYVSNGLWSKPGCTNKLDRMVEGPASIFPLLNFPTSYW